MLQQKNLYVGIDVDLLTFKAVYIDIDSNIYSKKKNKFDNNPQGVYDFIQDIIKIMQVNNFTNVYLGFEATNNYGFHLPFYFSNSVELQKYNPVVYQLNPRITSNFRKVFSDMPKNDDKDAYTIAERLKVGKLLPYTNYDPHYHALRILTRKRFTLITQLVQEKSRFLSNLFIKASGFAQNKVFSDMFGRTSCSLLTDFNSIEEIADIDLPDLINFILQKSKNHFSNPEKLASEIKYIARESYTPSRVIHDSITYSLLASFAYVKFLKSQIKNIDKQIKIMLLTFSNQYHIMTSLKGIGQVFAAGIIAEIGNINNFRCQDQIAKFAGLTWKIKQSGKFVSEETYLTKSGNKYLRYYLIQAAQSLVTHNPDFLPYYQFKSKESKKHKHKRAILFTARKLVRIIFCLLKNNKLYETPAYLKRELMPIA